MINVLGATVTIGQAALFYGTIAMTIFIISFYIYVRDGMTSYSAAELRKFNSAMARVAVSREELISNKKKVDSITVQLKVFKRLKAFPYSKERYDEIASIISKLDLRDKNGNKRTSDEYYLRVCYLRIATATIALLLLPISLPMSVLIIVVIVPGYEMSSLKKLKKLQIEEVNLIEKQMPAFLSMFYYRFRGGNSKFDLKSLADDFLPLSNSSMRRMLVRLQVDLTSLGDEMALSALLERYSESNYIYQFCSVSLGIFKKRDNAYIQLYNLYEELKTVRKESYKKQNRVRREKNNKANVVVYLLFGLEMMIFIIFQIGGF